MQIGVVFPQIEFPSDPAAVKEYAQTAEELDYAHLAAYDHVLGANPERPGGWSGPYTYKDPFQEPLILFGFMAGFTQRIQFTTEIIILPQRQTALVAKQAATLDVLSGGRLRLGVGLGWNEVEYTALNEDFHTRGRRMDEQVQLLRRLWTEPLVKFEGRWHKIEDAGINPLPVQRPIPLWFGGHSEPALRRTARLGDGWMANHRTPESAATALETLRTFLAEAGRAGQPFGIEARLTYGQGDVDEWQRLVQGWKEAGATHLSINTMGSGLKTAQEHIQAIRRFAEVFVAR